MGRERIGKLFLGERGSWSYHSTRSRYFAHPVEVMHQTERQNGEVWHLASFHPVWGARTLGILNGATRKPLDEIDMAEIGGAIADFDLIERTTKDKGSRELWRIHSGEEGKRRLIRRTAKKPEPNPFQKKFYSAFGRYAREEVPVLLEALRDRQVRADVELEQTLFVDARRFIEQKIMNMEASSLVEAIMGYDREKFYRDFDITPADLREQERIRANFDNITFIVSNEYEILANRKMDKRFAVDPSARVLEYDYSKADEDTSGDMLEAIIVDMGLAKERLKKDILSYIATLPQEFVMRLVLAYVNKNAVVDISSGAIYTVVQSGPYATDNSSISFSWKDNKTVFMQDNGQRLQVSLGELDPDTGMYPVENVGEEFLPAYYERAITPVLAWKTVKDQVTGEETDQLLTMDETYEMHTDLEREGMVSGRISPILGRAIAAGLIKEIHTNMPARMQLEKNGRNQVIGPVQVGVLLEDEFFTGKALHHLGPLEQVLNKAA